MDGDRCGATLRAGALHGCVIARLRIDIHLPHSSLPCGQRVPARPLGMLSTGLDPDAAARSVIIAEKAAPRAHGNGMLRIRFHAHIAVLLATLALFAGCATLGPSQQTGAG